MRDKNKTVALDKKPFLVLSRKAIAGWLCALFLGCAWMFLIGVLVGRGTAPVKFDINKIQEKIAAYQKVLKAQPKDQTQPEAALGDDKTTLDFYEALKDNREDTKIPERKPSPTISQKIEPLPATAMPQALDKAKEETAGPQIGIEAKPDDPKVEPVNPPQKETTPSQSVSEPSRGTFTIQTASVRNALEADRLVAALKKQGYPAYRMIGKIPGQGIWYRVRIGEYKSPEDARSTLAKLKKAGIKPILVEK
jgi:cell division protein FtsN